METKKQTTKAALITDVSKPGSLPPATATSRPVIVNNRPIMQDPMMAPAESATDSAPSVASQAAKQAAKVVIKPLDTASADEVEAIAVSVKPADTPVAASEPAPVEAVADAEVQQADEAEPAEKSDLVKETAALEADAKAQDELDQLVDEKTYFLPINAAVHRRSRNVFIVGVILIVLLALAWLNIAMDAGFVTIPGVRPVTHLFSN